MSDNAVKRENVEKAYKSWYLNQSPAMRKERALERKAVRDAMSPQAQLKDLDLRLGAGKGAVRERARLQKQILGVQVAPGTVVEVAGSHAPEGKKGLTQAQKDAKRKATDTAKKSLHNTKK